MAKRKPLPETRPLSDLAQWMLSSFGMIRLPMMLSEYQAELPHDMPKHIRQARIVAILELMENPEPQPPSVSIQTDIPVVEPSKIALADARRIAGSLLDRLTPHCQTALIAGSVRREKPEVKDIELVVLPQTYVAGSNGLFDEGTRHYAVTTGFRQTVESLGEAVKGKPDGRYMQIVLPEGLKLDLFMPEAHDFYRQFAIRTGSAEFSATRLAVGWKKKGWCGTALGLRRIADCEETKSGWKCIKPNPELPPAWQSEQEFFAWLGIPYLEPKDRI